MGDKSCLFFLVSLCNQTVEMFCLSNVIKKLNSNYVRRSCHLCCFCSKLMFFKRRRVIYSSNSTYAHQTNQKKNCIRPCDTNNSSQSLTRMYRHTATENLHRLNGAKISRPPSLARVSYQFDFIRFSICLQCKISGSSICSIFFP